MIRKSSRVLLIFVGQITCVVIHGCHSIHDNKEQAALQIKSDKLLSQTVTYYQHKGDSLGAESARFLVNNLSGQATQDPKSQQRIADQAQVTSQYLIGSINSSLTRCRELVRSGRLSKSDFFEYVLPYRLGSEALTDWKKDCEAIYKQLDDSLGKNPDPRSEALSRIKAVNAKLIGNHFKFSFDRPDARTLNFRQLLEQNSGNCVAMVRTITYPLRALGIASAIEFTTCWANVNGNGHSWNAYVSSGKPTPFLGFESSPPDYNPFGIYNGLGRLPAKVFRETYSKNPKALASMGSNREEIPASLDFNRAIDVTNQYFLTDNIKIRLSSQLVRNLDGHMLYLSCFNNDIWKPVFWSEQTDNNYRFKDMASRMLYPPSTFGHNSGVTAVDYPFVVDNGVVSRFRPDMAKRQDIVVIHTQPKELDALGLFGRHLPQHEFERRMNGIIRNEGRSRPENGVRYQLYYWRGGWKLAGSKAAKGNDLVFKDVPKGALYRLISEKNDEKTARIFSYNGRQQWW